MTRRFPVTLLALLVCLTAAAPAQEPSFARMKKDFGREFQSKDLNTRVAAIKRLAGHGHPEAVRYFLDVIKKTNGALTQARNEWAEATAERATLRREVRNLKSLVSNGKIGKKKLERAEAKLKVVSAKAAEYSKTITRDADIERTLRQAVGWVVQNCSDHHKRDAGRIIRTTYAGARGIDDKADLLRIMVWVDIPELAEIVAKEVEHREAPTRVAALRAIEERGGKRALMLAKSRMKDEAWQVRAQAIRILRKVGGKEAAEALTAALENEDGRLITDAMSALKKLTGQNFHDNVHLWRDWLAKNGDQLPEPTESENAAPERPAVAEGGGRGRGRGRPRNGGGSGGQKAGHGTGFYGINTTSKHIVYVIDYSGSMSAPLAGGRRGGGGGGGMQGGSGPAKIGGKRKVDGVATELLKSIDSLPKDGTFNVVLFNSGVVLWRKKMQKADRANKDAIRKWVLSRGPAGSTDLFGGVEQGFKFAGRGSFDKYYRSVVDTIFLLSDGSPTAGRIQATGQILREVRAMNDLRRIALHCVGLGRSINVRFLSRLARENDGEFVHITR